MCANIVVHPKHVRRQLQHGLQRAGSDALYARCCAVCLRCDEAEQWSSLTTLPLIPHDGRLLRGSDSYVDDGCLGSKQTHQQVQIQLGLSWPCCAFALRRRCQPSTSYSCFGCYSRTRTMYDRRRPHRRLQPRCMYVCAQLSLCDCGRLTLESSNASRMFSLRR